MSDVGIWIRRDGVNAQCLPNISYVPGLWLWLSIILEGFFFVYPHSLARLSTPNTKETGSISASVHLHTTTHAHVTWMWSCGYYHESTPCFNTECSRAWTRAEFRSNREGKQTAGSEAVVIGMQIQRIEYNANIQKNVHPVLSGRRFNNVRERINIYVIPAGSWYTTELILQWRKWKKKVIIDCNQFSTIRFTAVVPTRRFPSRRYTISVGIPTGSVIKKVSRRGRKGGAGSN